MTGSRRGIFLSTHRLSLLSAAPAQEAQVQQRGFSLSLALAFTIATLLSISIYLAMSARVYRIGFPLDDAWIHQTYARNLALRGEWAFIPGQPSAGSTAPLWTGLLALGHAMRLGPHLWAYLLGGGLLLALGLAGSWALCVYAPERTGWAPWAGVLLLCEWHLVWAALSGMETLLFALLALAALTWAASGKSRWFELGMLIGLTAWVRPDGVTLLGPALVTLLFDPARRPEKLRALLRLGLGFTLFFAPYLVFNRLLAGAWWPNTFFAKQAEYEATRLAAPFWLHYLRQWQPLLQGVGAVLLPGFLLFAFSAARRRSWPALAGAVWVAGYLALYAWRLPVAYQHGRYLLPALPAYLVMGISGMAAWARLRAPRLWPRAMGRAWTAAAGLVLVLYWFQGAAAYAGDVAFIESEMVETAFWVERNTGEGALIAAHDIGALGYFGQRPLLDLAGLVSPEVIPFIRDEASLGAFLDTQGAEYLVTFPGWYPALARRGSPAYQTQGRFALKLGGENMAVFKWK